MKTIRTWWSVAVCLSLATGLTVFGGVSRSDEITRKASSPTPFLASELASKKTFPQSLRKTDSPFQTQPYFERNDGQFDSQVLYASRGARYSLFLTRSGVTVSLNQDKSKDSRSAGGDSGYFSVRFAGANSKVVATGEDLMPGISNYFYGGPKHWHTRVPQFAKVRYANAYPGIDLVFYFRDGHLEYDAIAAPGADPNQIRFSVEHAEPKLTRDGDVAIEMAAKEVVRLRKPHAYQGNDASTVAVGYSLRGREFSFKLSKYDVTRPLVVDPALIFSSFIVSNCGQCQDSVMDIAADGTGVYLTGYTTATIFPGTSSGSAGTPIVSGAQTFVVKVDPTGAHVLYSTFLPNSRGETISVDSHGSAYVGGTATVPGTPAFPLTSGVFSGTVPPNAGQFGVFGTWGVPFATKLSADGSALVYSTLLQQPTSNGMAAPSPLVVQVAKIAVDSTGALYVAGTVGLYSTTSTSSIWMALPVTTGAYQTTPGSAYILKLNPTASGLHYATFIDGPQGASDTNRVGGLAVDSSGNAIVAGITSDSNFPTSPGAYQTTSLSSTSAQVGFVFELDPTGTNRIYSTLFSTPPDPTSGESGIENLTGVAVDSHGQAIIAGSASGTVPVTSNAFCGNAPYSQMGFVTKLKSDGSGIVFSTTLCGQDSPQGNSTVFGSDGQATSVAVDSSDAVYVSGNIGPPAAFQPALLHAIQSYFPNGSLVNMNTALKLDPAGNLLWSTFLGQDSFGNGSAEGKIAPDNAGNAYVLAYSDIPPTAGSFGPSLPQIGQKSDQAGGNVLVKIASSLGAPVPLVTPQQVAFTNQNTGVASSPVDVQVGNFGDAPMSPMISITGDFSETDTCSAPVPGGNKCDVSVIFTPTATGPRTGMLTLAFGGTIPSQTIPLSGNAGAPAVTLSPSSLSFGTQATGTTSTAQQVTVTNSGTGPLTVSAVQASSQFAATNTCGAPIPVGGTCTIQVTFTPTGSAVVSGTLTVVDNAPNSPQTISLTGNASAGLGLGVASGGSASATVSAGQTAAYSLSIGGQGLSGTATLTCTGAPTGATCSVPATVTLSPTAASKISVSVTTTAHSGLLPVRVPPITWLWAFAALGGLMAWRLISAKASPRLRWSLVPLFAVVLCACGGGSSNDNSAEATQAGSYTLVVTAKSGTTTQTQSLTLTVK